MVIDVNWKWNEDSKNEFRIQSYVIGKRMHIPKQCVHKYALSNLDTSLEIINHMDAVGRVCRRDADVEQTTHLTLCVH